MAAFTEFFLTSQKDVDQFEICLDKVQREPCTSALHNVFDQMELIIKSKFDRLHKKKEFYKSFR